MTIKLAQYSAHTIQKSIIQDTKNQRSDIAKLQRAEASGNKFTRTSEMTNPERQQSAELQNGLGRIVQLQNNAKDFLAKVDTAMRSVKNMQDKISSLSGTLVTTKNFSSDDKNLLRTEINSILQTMQVEMNSTYPGGGYLFASSADSNSAPVGDIVHTQNYQTDNIPNTNYVKDLSPSNQVTVAEGVGFNDAIDPADPAFRDTIAALHMMLDAINSGASSIPDSTLTLFSKAQSEMGSFLANNLATRHATTKNAIEQNDAMEDDINERIESTFKSDPLEISEMIASMQARLELSMSVLVSMINNRKLWDLLK